VSTIKESDCLLVGGGSDGSKIVADIRTDYSSKEVIANASIISTAPELLAELKLISEHFGQRIVSGQASLWEKERFKYINETISKAEGLEEWD
jgi:precorrin-6B methylase 2|tara:strand:+ start:474 stop:752 length:279 start_codon:yes stop_codon:yes gene_type:complete